MKKHIGLIVIQATPFCNIACKYCYLPNRESRQKMALSSVERIFANVLSSGWLDDRVTVVWHAGEPMALGRRYYEEAFRLIDQLRPVGLTVEHSFQTNGTLIDQEWCDFITSSKLKIGISLDGPQWLHDKYRVGRDGKGSFARVSRGIALLRENNIDFSVIAVLTRDSLACPDELFEFFKGIGVKRLAFNVEEIEGGNLTSSLLGKDTYMLYWRFLARFWERLINEHSIWTLREFEESLACIVRPAGTEMLNTQTTPFSMLNIDVNGNFSTFSPEFVGQSDERYGNFCFGNLNDVPLNSALDHPVFLRLNEDIQAGVKKCEAECPYFSVCGGGAPVNKLNENGSLISSETMFCRLTKKLPTDLALALLEQSAAQEQSGALRDAPVQQPGATRLFGTCRGR